MSFGQGGPAWGTGGAPTPDWSAMAEEAERRRTRRRRWLIAGGGALATAAVAGIVAVAVVNENGDADPSAQPSASKSATADPPSSAAPQPSFDDARPPAPPEDYLKDPEKDTAPLSTDTLFPDAKVRINGRYYTRAATDTAEDCATAVQHGLKDVVRKHHCKKTFRATYERDGLAVTVGISVFSSESAASKVKEEYKPNVTALEGGDVPKYCHTVVCRATVNSLGRYAVFTIAGHTDGKAAGPDDEPAKQAAVDGSNFGYTRLIQRGRAQAEADAEAG